MHVGYVLKKFPRLSETFILNEILELERQGVEVTIFSLYKPDDGVFHHQLADLSRPVVYLPTYKKDAQIASLQQAMPHIRNRREPLWEEFECLVTQGRTDLWSIMRWGMDIAIEAQRRGIDRLHAHFATIASYVARAAHAASGLPYSFTCHAKDIYREGVDPLNFQRLATPTDFVITVCEANRRHIEANLSGGNSLPVVTLYNGIDLDRFKPARAVDEEVPLILGVGRLVEKKGFDDLIAAAASLLDAKSRFRCVIIGDGEERSRLEGMIAELGVVGITLVGARSQEEVRSYLAKASMLVLPCRIASDGNRDALPTVLLEALACGVPVISTPVGGIDEILDGGHAGRLVPSDDRPALGKAMLELLADQSARDRLGKSGRQRAESCFDLSKNVGRLIRCFAAGAPCEEWAR